MSDPVLIRINGMEDLKRRMQSLSDDMQNKVARAAVGGAARLIAKEARARAPKAEAAHWRSKGNLVSPGVLAKSIVAARSRRDSRPGCEVWNVFVLQGKKMRAKGRDAYYAKWVEYGHWYVPKNKLTRVSRKGVVRTGHWAMHRAVNRSIWVSGKPFLRPAVAAKQQEAVALLVARLRERLDKAGV